MIVDKKFHNIKCDACGRLIDDETWWDDKDALTTQILHECNWIECEGRHYCDECWEYDDDDNIVTKDGRKYNGDTHEPIIERVNAADGTVQDGDILVLGNCIFIYKGIDTEGKFGGSTAAIIYHALTNIKKNEHIAIGPRIGVGSFDCGFTYRKAYKDECEQLFAKLKAMGFEWDAEKKNIVKIKED